MREAIGLTAEWFKAWEAGDDVTAVMDKQIETMISVH